MKEKKKAIIVATLSTLLLFILIIGNTYAYFSSMIVGNSNAKGVEVTTGTMKIVYENTQEIRGENLLPGWKSEEITFTVENTGTLPVMYNINIVDVTSTFGKSIDGVLGKPEELVYKLAGDNGIKIDEKQFLTSNSAIAYKIEIKPKEIHTYKMQVIFKETGENQDYNQGREFAGKIEIVETELSEKAIADFGTDESHANEPELNNGLIPVTWNGNEWVKADTSKAWYNYEKQAWANAVTVTLASRSKYTSAPANTEIDMKDIETMWVWVPRYEYQHTNLGEQYAGGTQTQPGGITINFISKDTTTPSSENYTIHDAFWWDDNNDGIKDTGEQLAGIWVAKFEMSTGASKCTPVTNDVEVGCDITTITPQIKPNVTSWRGARVGTFWTAIHNNMNGENNIYGLTNSDAHLMKNMEWGAVAYLSQSKYGKYGNANYEGTNKEIYQNKSTEYLTGMSNQKPSTTTRYIQSPYDTEEKGTGASTTGNIYGIYDISSGATEYVMGINKVTNNTEPMVGNTTDANSGWSGKLYNGTDYIGTYGQLKGIGSKYYDLYDYDFNTTWYHKGDATEETASWYSDRHDWNRSDIFFERSGGQGGRGGYAGAFYFDGQAGQAMVVASGRPVLVQTN